MKQRIELVLCPRPYNKGEIKLIAPDKINECDLTPNCEVCAKMGQTIIDFSLPYKSHPLAYLTIHKILRILGVIWLIFTPTLAAIMLSFIFLGHLPPVRPTIFWLVMLISLYWLYFFNKREKPSVLVGPEPNGNYLDIASTFSTSSLDSIYTAYLYGSTTRTPTNIGHLLLALLDNPRVRLITARLGLDYMDLKKRTISLIKSKSTKSSRDFASDIRAVLFLSYEEAVHLNEKYVEPEDLLLATLEIPSIASELFKEIDVSYQSVQRCTQWVIKMLDRSSLHTFFSYFLSPTGVINQDMTGTVTPELDRVCIDFTKMAQKRLLPEIVGKITEKDEISDTLVKSTKNNVLLIGPAGSGKTSIVQGLAQDIADGVVSSELSYKRLVSLDLGSLISGAKNQGELEGKMQNILHDLEFGNIILFLDDIHNLASAKIGESEVSILALLEKPLSSGKLQIIGATTREEYHKYVEKEATIARLFNIIEVSKTEQSECLDILTSYTPVLERKYRVLATFPALKEAVELSERYIHDRVLPDKAIDVLEQSLILAKKKGSKILKVEFVKEVITTMTKIPVQDTNKDESDKLLHLEQKLHKRIIGQDEAVTAVANALRRARAGLKPDGRPIAAFLFLGPTGVGKTELAKALSEAYFGAEKNMTRLDMAEYSNEDSIFQLIGAAPGQKGAEAGGQLTEAVRNQPYSLLLLDEIEKANTKIINTFLSVLDDGRLTDSSGTEVDFTNTIIIATSNAGSDIIQKEFSKGAHVSQIREVLIKNLGNYFRPEFLNRFDAIIVYQPLTKNDTLAITKLMLDSLNLKLKEKGIEFRYGPRLVDQVAQAGFDPLLGGRPLRRVIQDRVENYLAQQILLQKIQKGQTITLNSLP